MRTEHLYYFKCLAEVLNYTQASKLLYIGQPTLSAAIKNLEKEVGATLFIRSKGSRVDLTEAGTNFYDYVSLSLNALEKGCSVAQEIDGSVQKTIRLGTLFAMQGKAWSSAVAKFRRECPIEFSLETQYGYTPDMLRKLRAGVLDVAFCSHMPGDQDMERVFCWSLPLVLAVHKTHPLASKKEISLEELKGISILTYNKNSSVSYRLEEFVKGYDLDLKRNYVDDLCMSSFVVSDPDSVALFCYSFLCDVYDELVYLPITGAPKDFHPMYMTYVKDRKRLKVVQEFIDFMGEYFATDEYKKLHDEQHNFLLRKPVDEVDVLKEYSREKF